MTERYTLHTHTHTHTYTHTHTVTQSHTHTHTRQIFEARQDMGYSFETLG